MLAALQDNMRATTTVATIGPGHVIEFCVRKMLAPGAAVPRSAKDPDLVYKV
jgi:hypothetical protein